jgi:putative FmdB family regulatory protein
MPIYEFKCTKCGETFEKLCRLEWAGTLDCPACGDTELAKLLSRFGGLGSSDGAGCGSCSSKNCGSCK